jgi:hypothetical protein
VVFGMTSIEVDKSIPSLPKSREMDPMDWRDFDLFLYFAEKGSRMFECLFERLVGREIVSKVTNEKYLYKSLREAQLSYENPLDGKTPNPYHNALHGADVFWSARHLTLALRSELRVSLKLNDNPNVIFDISIAALFHDYKHCGVNNYFLIRTKHNLAMRYCDRAVLEHHHASEALRLLDRTKVTENMSYKRRSEFRKRVSSIILATDFVRQNESADKVEHIFAKYLKAVRGNDPKPELHLPSFQDTCLQNVLNLIVECCDVGHPTKSFRMHRRW